MSAIAEPSPGCQVTETGVAVAVTLSPGTVAVFDSGTHSAGLIHSDQYATRPGAACVQHRY